MDLYIYMWREASPTAFTSLIPSIFSVTLGSAACNQIKVIYFLSDTVNLKIHGIAILIGGQSHSRFFESWYFLKQPNEIIVIFVQNESLRRRCQAVSQSNDAMCRQGKPEKKLWIISIAISLHWNELALSFFLCWWCMQYHNEKTLGFRQGSSLLQSQPFYHCLLSWESVSTYYANRTAQSTL